ncbi:hypothetical protein IMSAG049_00416 [Clostridiales bacterium]|nr:hypothetical protein IMSAG049_00416 [Clostridiales bacterium]
MNKPASVAIKEFSLKLEDCINESALPPIVIEMIMRGYYLQIKEMADRQTKEEEEQYKKEKEVKDDGE